MNLVGSKQISSKRLNKPCILLIFISGMERFAFKGVASNLVTYLTDVVKMSNSSAAKTVNSWCGFTSIMPLLVASFADSYWDQYFTILASSFVYVLGLVALTSTALAWAWVPRGPDSSTSYLFWSLGLISLGLGGYNPSLQAFAADQAEAEDELPCSDDDSLSSNGNKTLFFQWWYFGICSGSLLGFLLTSFIQDSIGWGLGFSIPAVVLIVSIVIFACGRRFYTYKQDRLFECRPFEDLIRAIKSSAAKMMSCGITFPSKKSHTNEMELEEKPLCAQDFDGIEVLENRTSRLHLMENVKVILRLLPIWTMFLTFAIIFQQPATFFTKQGMTMKRNIGSNFKIPPATLQSAITFSIILLMPLYDKVLIPITILITSNEKGISVMQRMGIGMALSIIAMTIAAIVESKRLQMSSELTADDIQQGIPVPLSIFWLLPQYILLGISDIFTVVGMQEYFYSEVPIRMKTMGIALYTSVFGAGSFVSVLLISVIERLTSSGLQDHGWFSDDMREARLDKYYWVLTLLSAISLLLYVVLCRFYRCRDGVDEESHK